MTANHSPNTDLLFEHFATLATAPEGIARLRELILQLAVQGKLGTQDEGDEPLDEIIKKILKQNQKATEKKGHYSKIEDSELYFTIPKKWNVLRLGEICSVRAGGTPDRKNPAYWENGTVPWIKIQDIREKYVTKTSEYITEEGLKNSSAYLMEPDTILYTIFATIGKAGILKFKACSNQAIVGIKPDKEIISLEYLYLHLIAIQSYYAQLSRGLAQNNINQTILKNAPIYLPPITEQFRIVEKVDRLMTLCDELEARQQKELAGCLRLGTASLAGLQNAESPEEFERRWERVCDAFDLILDCPENVAVLRQTILQLAVQGRLVMQEHGDEPSGKIIEKIRKEKAQLVKTSKIKNQKILEPISDIEKSYQIPEKWSWIRLGEVIDSMANGLYKPSTFYSNKGIVCFRMYNINSGKINFENLQRLKLDEMEIQQYLVKEGDLLVNRVNSKELVGKAAVIPALNEPFIFEAMNIRVRLNSSLILPTFVNILFQTKEVWRVWQGNAKQTCGQASVSQPQIAGICTPLPPLAEQQRIVAKVDALMALCDALESRLKERADVQARLAGAVVKQVAGGM